MGADVSSPGASAAACALAPDARRLAVGAEAEAGEEYPTLLRSYAINGSKGEQLQGKECSDHSTFAAAGAEEDGTSSLAPIEEDGNSSVTSVAFGRSLRSVFGSAAAGERRLRSTTFSADDDEVSAWQHIRRKSLNLFEMRHMLRQAHWQQNLGFHPEPVMQAKWLAKEAADAVDQATAKL
eukprot:TRINITY_DN7705_c0_g1_i1.p1 TRINITY_DN7705_c0_g1~~TRINITY_DN7705_c0_g1_i1.p1  ORF type:complete len:189 (-),score=45.09 TRINITY_DN7705_c0_g1_i1:525-1067(-)